MRALGLTQPRWILPLGLTALAVGVTSLPRFDGSDLPSFAAAILMLAAAGAWYGSFESRWSPEVPPKLQVGGMAAAVLLLSLLYDLLVQAIAPPAGIATFLLGVQLSAAAAAVLVLLATSVDFALLGRVRVVRWFSVLLAAGFAFTVAVRTFGSHVLSDSAVIGFVTGPPATIILNSGLVLLGFLVPLEWLVRMEVRSRVASLAGMVAALAPLAAAWAGIVGLSGESHQHLLAEFVELGAALVFSFCVVVLIRSVMALPGASAFERKLRELDAVYDFGLAAGTAFDHEQLQSAVLEAMLRVAEPDVALMVEPDARGRGMRCVLLRAQGDIEHVYRYGARTPWKGLRDRFADRRPVVVVDHRKAPPAALAKVWEPAAGSSVVVPVITQDDVLRAVLIAGRFETHAFDSSEVRSLRGFANQVALALDHARLLRDTVEAERRKKELEIARELQLNLLPKEPPAVAELDVAAYSDPATEVGGDYYDYLTLTNGNPAIVVGDVAGHGMPAGLLMATAKSAIHTQSQSENPPTVLMERLSRTLHHMSADNQFMTLVFAELDLERGKLVFSNAGHHYPLHYRASSGAIEELESTGIPLGLLPVPPGPFVERDLDPGDVLILYSDGVVEATNPEDEMFGTSRLGEVVLAHRGRSAKTVLEAIFDAVNVFVDGEPLHDDTTAVVVRVLTAEEMEAADADATDLG
ncbi:MAG: SpoIIE family protein phosphatase [Acidobacteria bacterium]|nr:SpoIIE family protein phosphatase [Acidobacteriota bacterium]